MTISINLQLLILPRSSTVTAQQGQKILANLTARKMWNNAHQVCTTCMHKWNPSNRTPSNRYPYNGNTICNLAVDTSFKSIMSIIEGSLYVYIHASKLGYTTEGREGGREGERKGEYPIPQCSLTVIYTCVFYKYEFQSSYYFTLICTVDNSPEIIKHLKIALGVVAAFLVLLGPCGCYCICCCYKNNVHNRCKEKFKCVNPVRAIMCCKDYIPIDEPVGNNQQNGQINNRDLNQNQQA